MSRQHYRRGKNISGHFPDPVVQLIVETDLKLIDHYDPIIKELDKQILSLAKDHDRTSLQLPEPAVRLSGTRERNIFYGRPIKWWDRIAIRFNTGR